LSQAIRAFSLAAFLAAVAGTLVLAIYSAAAAPLANWTASNLKIFGLVFVYCLTISIIALVLVAVPATLLLSRLSLERSWVYPLLGFGTAIVVLLLFADRPSDLIRSPDLIAALGLGISGALAGAVWWSLFRVRHAEGK
jgi:hypothetical protein